MDRPRYIHGTPRPRNVRLARGTVRASVRRPLAGEGRPTARAVFLDRDGTLIEDVDYCSDPGRVRLIDGASESLRRLRGAGFLLIIITNQSGIGRGYFTVRDFEAVQGEVMRQLGGDLITRTYYSPDPPGQESSRRKPSPLMVFEAMRDYHIDPTRSWFIGDKDIDMECGRRAGVRGVLVRTGHGASSGGHSANHHAESIRDAVDYILSHEPPAVSPR